MNTHPEYILHGEMQMGVGVAVESVDGNIRGVPASDGMEKWINYIRENNHAAHRFFEKRGFVHI